MSIEDARHPWLAFTAMSLGVFLFITAMQYWIGGRTLLHALGYAAVVMAIGGVFAALKLRSRLRSGRD